MTKSICLLVCAFMLTALLAGCAGESASDEGTPTVMPTATIEATATPTPETNTPTPDPDSSSNSTDPDGGIESLLEQMYAGVDSSFELPFLMNTPLSNDMEYGEQGIAYFIGTHEINFSEGVASEAAIGAIAYSVVMLRLEPDFDPENAKTLIKNNVDPRKWICVGADSVIVDNLGDLVILIMTSEETNPGLGEAIQKAFLALDV